MCLCRSNGTGVVVRRRVAADARLPVAILLPVPSPLSPPPTVTIFVVFAVLFFSAVNCSATFEADSIDETEKTESSTTIDPVPEAGKTTSGDRLTSTNFGDVVTLSYELKSQMTTETFQQFTPVDADLDGSNQSPQVSVSSSTETANRHIRSSITPEVAFENSYVSTWARLLRREKAVSATSGSDYELPTTSRSSLNSIRQSATENRLPYVSSKSTISEDFTTTVPEFGEQTDVGLELTVAADVRQHGATEIVSDFDVTSTAVSKLDYIGDDVDSFDAEYFNSSTRTKSNTWRDDDSSQSRRLMPPTKAADRRTTSRRLGERKRCLRMRTGGGDSVAMDC